MILDKVDKRKPNAFEQILLLVGILAIAIGYYFVHNVVLQYGTRSFEATSVILIWIITIILIILTAVSENSKEELKIIIKQQHEETCLLRDDLKRKR